ncbi:MAG: efflux RND transporter permease subunit [Bacteroidales bacterium]|nr:efflux RND transporter permease subunit [Bacteroidales bacterium]
MINKIIDFSLKNRLLTVFIIILISITGILLSIRMPKDIYPDLSAPLVTIVTNNPGMATEDVERLISFPLESLLNGAPHVTRVRSESATGSSIVTVEFDWGIDIYLARQIVSSNLDIVSGSLPQGSIGPHLGPVSSRMGEVFEFAVVGDSVDPMELRSIADWTIRYRLQGVPGVSFVINMGGFVKQFKVLLNPDMLKHYNITIQDVKNAIESSNRNFSGGILSKGTQEELIKGEGRISSIEDINNTVITSNNYMPVYVKNVAKVEIGPKFRRDDASFNGQPSVDITIQKQYGGNTLAAIKRVKKALAQIAKNLPDNIRLEQFYDQSKLITKSINHVERSILEGAFLIILIMMLFMWDIRSSLIASLTIPLSIFVAFIILSLFKVQLTVMSIGGLAIGVGKVASGTIIMVENIFTELVQNKGKGSTIELTYKAAKDVGSHLFSTSLIIILVFLPLLSLNGIEGAMFKPTAFAVVGALFGSLLLNLTLKPVLCSVFLTENYIKNRNNPVMNFFNTRYKALLEKALDHKKVIFYPSIALVILAAFLYNFLGKEFVPPLDEGAILASTVMLPETSLEETAAMGDKIEKIFMSFPEVLSVARTTGSAEGSEHLHPVCHSEYNIRLVPREERKRDFKEITEEMRQKLNHLPGVAYIFEQPIANKMAEMMTGTAGELSVKLFGQDWDVLNQKIGEILNVMTGIDGAADLQIEQTTGIPQLVLKLKRNNLARYGIRVSDVADLIETALNGNEVTDVYEKNRITSVLIRLPEEYRKDEEMIRNLLVEADTGERIPLTQLAEITHSQGPQTILRENMMRRKLIACSVVNRDVGSFVKDVQQKIDENVHLPAGYYITYGGSFENQQRAMKELITLMLVVILIIFVVLFTSFGSIRQAALIIISIPLSLVGAIIGLLITGQTINVSSMIGLIALFGVCVQNDVILVAKINDYIRQGYRLRDAVMAGSLKKFRAIFMTNLVMVAGALPLVLHVTTGAELHRPLAVVYIGGFIGAILIRMIAMPVFYEALEKLRKSN